MPSHPLPPGYRHTEVVDERLLWEADLEGDLLGLHAGVGHMADHLERRNSGNLLPGTSVAA